MVAGVDGSPMLASPSPAGSATSSPGRTGMLALLASSVLVPEPSSVAGAVDAVMGRASRYLPASMSRRRSSSAAPQVPQPPPPPPAAVSVRLLSGDEARVEVTAETTLEQLQQSCEAATAVPPPLQQLCIQEEPRAPGLGGLLRATANHLGSRERVARSLQDWGSFLLLPEGVSRELKGQGLVSWVQDNVWQPLMEQQQAPPGTVRVLVATLDGRRRSMLVSSGSSLRQLRREVQQAAAVPTDQQRLLVLQQRQLSHAQRVARALVRLLLVAAVWAFGLLAAAGRWLLGLPASSDVRLQLVTESGRALHLSVSPDTTLQQLQQRLWEEHGEQLSLQQLLSLSPTKSGSCSPEKGGGDGGGGERSLNGSPAKRRLA